MRCRCSSRRASWPGRAGPFFVPDELSEDKTEEEVARRCLREGAPIHEERYPLFAASRVVTVDEVAEGIKAQMLRERHPKREAARFDRNPGAESSIYGAEEGSIDRMEGEPSRAPAGAARHRFAQQRDVGIAVPEDALIEWLEQSPNHRGRRAGCRGGELWRRAHRGSLTGMPEGDSLARAARRLQALVGERVEVETPHPRAAVKQLAQRLDGRRLLGVEAAGKNLLFRFEEGVVLRSHLRMSGRWRVQARGAKLFGRPWLVLRGAEREAVLWNGPVLELDDRAVRKLGPDILAEPPDLETMIANVRRDPRRSIGDAMLDQRLIAGIGNVWRAEALWEASVSPWRPAGETSDDELRAVLGAAHKLMTASVETGNERRVVYNRAGRGCRRCGTPIEARGQGDANRTAYWCPACQV
jgi:endonuclease VIII